MKKYTYSIIFLFIFSSVAIASIFPPDCVYEIIAKVLSVKEKPVKKDKYQTENLTHVIMQLEIIMVGKIVKDIFPEKTCHYQYKVGQKITVTTIKERDFVNKNVVIKPLMLIRGNIEYTGDERGPGYYFDHIDLESEYREQKGKVQ